MHLIAQDWLLTWPRAELVRELSGGPGCPQPWPEDLALGGPARSPLVKVAPEGPGAQMLAEAEKKTMGTGSQRRASPGALPWPFPVTLPGDFQPGLHVPLFI